ncbi:hypothetical protein DUT91_23875 [Phyllobacterium salinisoli]|uniref:DUF3991 domain-containing protein n=1 Tax=Phyllobacterium salinisoli TaxID=1899321 RepID=A0A368JZ91_9HYPH|nr:hypothetical protein DUT91_23875 [Phyllobacterium salinisoli]
MVDAQIHEYGPALRGADLNPRSRRLIKRAKDSGHYPNEAIIRAAIRHDVVHEGPRGSMWAAHGDAGANLGRKTSLDYHRDLIATAGRRAGVILPGSALGSSRSSRRHCDDA